MRHIQPYRSLVSRSNCRSVARGTAMQSGPAARTLARALPGCVALLMLASVPLAAQERFTIPEILAPAFPFDLVSAKAADRIAWIEYERGMRNVYTAVAPDFRPVRLTEYLEDDGTDLSELQISDDGSLLLFVRGHTPNREGWIANPASDPEGAERAAWAVRSGGGAPWRIAEAWDPVLAPDGKWIAYTKAGQVYRAPVELDALAGFDPDTAGPLFIAFGRRTRSGSRSSA